MDYTLESFRVTEKVSTRTAKSASVMGRYNLGSIKIMAKRRKAKSGGYTLRFYSVSSFVSNPGRAWAFLTSGTGSSPGLASVPIDWAPTPSPASMLLALVEGASKPRAEAELGEPIR